MHSSLVNGIDKIMKLRRVLRYAYIEEYKENLGLAFKFSTVKLKPKRIPASSQRTVRSKF